MSEKDVNTIECNSYDGVTIGLIDGIISICSILVNRDTSSTDVKEALKDLRSNIDVIQIINHG